MIIKLIKNILGFLYFLYFNKLNKKNIIFLFHDINNTPSNYVKKNKLSISKENFKKIVEHIYKNYNFVDPRGLNLDKQNKFALITFDDGYKSYIKNAVSILEKKKIPSIVFVNSEVSLKKKLNINAEVDYLSKNLNFINFMKQNKISYPFTLNIFPHVFKITFTKIKKNIIN